MSLIEGFLSRVFAQAESSLGGSVSGTYHELTGKVSFKYNPVIDGRLVNVDVWRNQTSESYSKIYWVGEIVHEYAHNDLFRLLLGSLLSLYNTESDTPASGLTRYSYRPPRVGATGSLKLGIDYNPSGPFYLFHGVVVDGMSFAITRQNTFKVRISWKALRMQDLETEQSSGSTKSEVAALVHLNSSLTLNGSAMSRLSELNWTIQNPIVPVRFGIDKKPARFSRNVQFSMTGELVEYFGNTDIADLVASLGEQALDIVFTLPGTQKALEIHWPRVQFTSGMPDGVAISEISYRAAFKGLQDQEINTSSEPYFRLVN